MDLSHDPQLFDQFLQMRLERALPRDAQFGQRKFFLKNGERAQRGGDAFFRNQPAGLEQPPAPIDRRFPPHIRELVQRQPRTIDPQTLRRAPQLDQPIRKRTTARKHQRHRAEELLQLRAVIADVLLLRDIGAMKRNHARLIPALDERQQVHAGVAEINVHQIGAAPLQQRGQHLVFASIHDGRAALHEFQPAVPQRIGPRLRN